ncbi:hypothetical protein MN116_008293 [Schistosoma mekongi]|uniref:Mediator of RNA polymerase II transcription subunit 19 n=1 Tax=Schistosoma mekongi TaxID=38744 RepID=A0AAE1Z5U8_SCHME|nr:hypothetical protein MN116_008293 [Schistosoma mekongi]
MNPSPALPTSNVTGSNLQTGNTGSATWINKLKIVGRGQNWAVAPCEPFYLMGTEPPAPDAALTGAKNLIEHYGLENAYQKFCGKRLREELNAFLPHLSGNIDVPASVDGSGLMSLIERPPIRGKELRPFAPSQLDHAFRLHPGPLPQEYASLFAAAPSKHIHRSVQEQPQLLGSSGVGTASRIPATAVVGVSSGSFHRRRRRHEVHRGTLASGSDSSSSMGLPGIGGNVSVSPASFFTGPPTAYPQLGTAHTATSLSSKPMLSHSHSLPSSSITTSAPCTNVSIPNQSSSVLDNNPVTHTVNQAKLVDHPPGLIPVSAPHPHPLGSSLSSTSLSEPPPPPVLAPIHHSGQKLQHSGHNALSSLNPLYNNSSSNPTEASLTPNKSNPLAPPVLHSIHPPNTNPTNSSVPQTYVLPPHPLQHPHQFYQQHQPVSHLHHHQHVMSSLHHHQHHSSQSYLPSLSQNSSRSMSPTPIEANSSSPPSPDIHKIRRLDMTDEERRRKKRREKKRRKDKD